MPGRLTTLPFGRRKNMCSRREDRLALAAMVLMSTSMLGIRLSAAAGPVASAEIRVGIQEGDIRGEDHRALQSAVDYVAGLGGGTVYIGPGRFQMRNALILRDNVRIVGVEGKTVLAACAGVRVRLAADGDCNQREITVTDPSGFRIGDGVAIADSQSASGFTVTTATITAKLGANTFRISQPLYLDYMVSNDATARLA